MKKYIIYIFMLMIILTPLKIYAAEIVNSEITGVTEKSIGEEFILDFKVDINDLEKNKTLGIWIAGFELIFDDELLVLSDISSEDFNSYIYKEDGKYYVISEVLENSNSDNMCSNKVLYCGNYQVSIKFYIKNTELNETSIKMGEIEIGLLDMLDETKTYTIDDLISLNKISEQTHTLKINKTSNEISEEPKNIIKDEKPTFKESQTTNKKEDTNIKSSNAFIKELLIDKYNIKFEKNKTNYILTLEEDINELDINIKLEDELATYKIIGADDLKTNNNEVAIIVTAEDNTILTYTINVKYETKIIKEKESKIKIDFKGLIEKYLTKDNLTYIGIGVGIIIIIILIIILINKKQNKKINKLLGEL